jgi:hypothetical protein
MNYESMSDFEINKLVAKTIPVMLNDDQSPPYKCKESSVMVNDIVNEFEFNPCNNPSDAWSIIIDNKISIMNDVNTWEASIDFDGDLLIDGTDEVLTECYAHENPLRAAMIVFLMMQND